jgi:hypothetical protein
VVPYLLKAGLKTIMNSICGTPTIRYFVNVYFWREKNGGELKLYLNGFKNRLLVVGRSEIVGNEQLDAGDLESKS